MTSAWAADAFEVIVADGGSTDGTAEIASESGAQVLTAPAGRAAQQNISHCNPPFRPHCQSQAGNELPKARLISKRMVGEIVFRNG